MNLEERRGHDRLSAGASAKEGEIVVLAATHRLTSVATSQEGIWGIPFIFNDSRVRFMEILYQCVQPQGHVQVPVSLIEMGLIGSTSERPNPGKTARRRGIDRAVST